MSCSLTIGCYSESSQRGASRKVVTGLAKEGDHLFRKSSGMAEGDRGMAFKERRLILGEMADCRIGWGSKNRGEPGASCSTGSREVLRRQVSDKVGASQRTRS